MEDVLNVKPVLLKQNAPEMDAFQQRLLNSQRETFFLLKPDAPKTNAFHVKDVVNIEPFLFDTMPPKWMKDVLNVKPVLLKQDSPEMDAFQQRLLNSQRETYFLLNLFCLTQCPSSLLQLMRRSILSSLTEACTLQVHPLQIPDRQSSNQSTDEASWIHID